MSVRIPTSLVPRAQVDYDAEARQILGQDLVMADGYRIPPLTAGRLIALELVSSPFFINPAGCDLVDAAAAIVLLSCERTLIPELTGDLDKLLAAAGAWLAAHIDALSADYAAISAWIIDIPFYGFAMRPGGEAGRKHFIFDGAFVGAVLAPAAKLLCTSIDEILWRTPLCTVGHAIAQQDASLGVKGVERPPDVKALESMMAEAEEREKSGQLHPWQYMDPINYPLTDVQVNAKPGLIPLFDKIRDAFLRSGGKPVDPAKYPVPTAPSASEAERTTQVEAQPPCKASSLSVEDADTAFSTISVQDLSWIPRGSSANPVTQEISIHG